MFDIIGFGNLNFDLLYKVNKLAKPGTETKVAEYKAELGGSAANTIAGLARLGFKTAYIGAVGNDLEGQRILEEFQKEQVDTSLIAAKEGSTSTVLIIVDSKGERTMYYNPGVSTELNAEDIKIVPATNTKLLHLSPLGNKEQLDLQTSLVKLSSSSKISLCPGHAYSSLGMKPLKPILEKTDVLILNSNEARLLTKAKTYNDACDLLIEAGVKNIAVTLGKDGCYLTNKKEEHKVSGHETKVLDTTGAGDAFAVGFLAGFLNDKDLKKCGKLGNKMASMCIQKLGAREGLPRELELNS